MNTQKHIVYAKKYRHLVFLLPDLLNNGVCFQMELGRKELKIRVLLCIVIVAN